MRAGAEPLLPDLLRHDPLRVEDGIPIFAESTAYVANYERIAKDHLGAEAQTGHNPFIPEALWRDSEAATIALLRRHTRPGDRILDAGVGLGRVLRHFPDRERHGVDISLDYLRRSREDGIRVAMALVEDLPFRDGTFDLVLASDLLEHVLDLNAVIHELFRVLRPGGILLIRSPNDEDLWQYLAPDHPYEYVHLRTFDEPALRLLFSRAFHAEIIEVALAGYYAMGRYMTAPLPMLSRRAVSRFVLRPLSRSRAFRTRVLPRLYRPVEINMVVRRPIAPS